MEDQLFGEEKFHYPVKSSIKQRIDCDALTDSRGCFMMSTLIGDGVLEDDNDNDLVNHCTES